MKKSNDRKRIVRGEIWWKSIWRWMIEMKMDVFEQKNTTKNASLHLSSKSKKAEHATKNQIKSNVCTYLHKRHNRMHTRTHWWTVACDTGCIQCWRAVAVVEDVVAVPLLGSPRNEHCCWVDDRHEIPQHCDEMTWWFFKWNWNCERWELWVVLES